MLRHLSCVWLCDTMIVAHQAPWLWDSPSKIYFILSINSVGLLSLVAQTVKNPPAMWETWIWSLGWNVPCRRAWQPIEVVPIYILICRRIPFSAHPLQHLFMDFFMKDILTDVKYYLTVLLTCIFLIIRDVVFVSHLYVWKNVCLGLFPVFSLDCLVCWLSCLCILKINPC